ncbi:hypothetical protein B0H13DRAFT_2344957 [Mycena leptocephala]|nr:hypothetical protein B0H13DRAFT_2344957 [Mycena leptocephala]
MPLQYDQISLAGSTLIFPGVRLPAGDRFGGNLGLDAAMMFSSLIEGSGCMPIRSLHYSLLGLFGGIFILKTTLKWTLRSINAVKARNLAQSADARCFGWRKYRSAYASLMFASSCVHASSVPLVRDLPVRLYIDDVAQPPFITPSAAPRLPLSLSAYRTVPPLHPSLAHRDMAAAVTVPMVPTILLRAAGNRVCSVVLWGLAFQRRNLALGSRRLSFWGRLFPPIKRLTTHILFNS